MQIHVRVCDIDQRVGTETKQYAITQGDRTCTVDLCDEHSEWLDELLAMGEPAVEDRPPLVLAEQPAPATPRARATRKTGTAPTPTRGRRGGVQVRTLADIEQEKASRT